MIVGGGVWFLFLLSLCIPLCLFCGVSHIQWAQHMVSGRPEVPDFLWPQRPWHCAFGTPSYCCPLCLPSSLSRIGLDPWSCFFFPFSSLCLPFMSMTAQVAIASWMICDNGNGNDDESVDDFVDDDAGWLSFSHRRFWKTCAVKSLRCS